MGGRPRHRRPGPGPGSGSGAPAVVVGVALLALTGCGAGVAEGEARAAGDAFVESLASDPATACERLAPETRRALEEDAGAGCETAIGTVGLGAAGETVAVSVAGHGAQVRYREDTLFLALFDDGWRVTAAGCARVSDDPADPYDCDVDGG